jgi:hypothetical protein
MSDEADRPDSKYQREARRRQWIKRFRERQCIAREWICFNEITDWCAHSMTGVSADTEEQARTLAYQRLDRSARDGKFETAWLGHIQSRILYLNPGRAWKGKNQRCLTREQLDYVQDIRYLAAYCWLPRELTRQWLAAHGYPWPTHFDLVAATSPAAASQTAASPEHLIDDRRPGPKDGEKSPKDLACKIALEILDDDGRRPELAHGWKTKIAWLVNAELTQQGHNYLNESVRRMLLETLKEWESKHPNK